MQIFFHPQQLLHRPQTYFSRGKMRAPQEKPERMQNILATLIQAGYPITEPADFGIGHFTKVHTPDFIDFLRHAYREWHELPEDWGEEVMSNIFIPNNRAEGILAKAARHIADGSAPIGKHTWISAYWSAQTALAGADSLIQGSTCALGLTRPAGHHARADAAGGFCYLNNAAIAAEYLKQRFSKIAIIDTDMHHGQGVQEIFYGRNDILYTSVHGDPVNFYPVVAGFANELGGGEGYGFNRNFPLPHGTSEQAWFTAVEQAMDVLRSFQPDAVIHILGFDVYRYDPQSQCNVDTPAFRNLAKMFKALDCPQLHLLEGGYCIEALGQNMLAFLDGLAD